jgi:hypothetical protein
MECRIKEQETREEICEFIASKFANLLLNGINRERIIFIWGKHLPSNTNCCISGLSKLIEIIALGEIHLIVHQTYIEIFSNCPSMRIPKTELDQESTRYLSFFEKEHSQFFYISTPSIISDGDGEFNSLEGFKYDNVFGSSVNRLNLIEDILFKILLVSVDLHDGMLYDDALEICYAAVKKVFVTKIWDFPMTPEKKQLGFFMLKILTGLKGQDLFQILVSRKNKYACDFQVYR